MRHLERAQALVEGVAGIALITVILVGAVLLLVNLATVLTYQQKLTMVAGQAASACVDNYIWQGMPRGNPPSQIQTTATNTANSLLRALGLPQASSVSVGQVGQAIVVRVRVNQLALIGRGNILPQFLPSLEATGAATFINQVPPAILQINPVSSATGTPAPYNVVVPCYGAVGGPLGHTMGMVAGRWNQYNISIDGQFGGVGVYDVSRGTGALAPGPVWTSTPP